VALKWPHDVIAQGRKLAGLLSESLFVGSRVDSVVIGAGINVNTDLNQAPTFIANATSLRIELGHPIDRLPLLVAYLEGVAHRYAQFKRGTSPYDEWASRLVTISQEVIARSSGTTSSQRSGPTGRLPQELRGVAEGVDTDGALLLRTADGTVHRLLAADISLTEHVLTPPRSPGSGTPIRSPGHAWEDWVERRSRQALPFDFYRAWGYANSSILLLEATMFEDLRERATAELEEIEPEPSRPLADLLAGLTAQQRFVLSLMLLLNVIVIGCMCLVAFEKIQFWLHPPENAWRQVKIS
jgi:hypothetical protein